jgi:nucleotide-binding universal stress UspA family protein
MSRILVPLDGSAASERAIPVALRMAEQMGGDVVLVRIHEPRRQAGVSEQRGDLDIYLQKHCDRLGSAVRSRAGESATAVQGILRIVDEEAADLIVMSSHGRTAARELALGSVARDLLRSSPVPIVLVGLSAAQPT